jgi:integrase
VGHRGERKHVGLPVGPKVGKIRFEDAADDLETEYRVNERRSLDELGRRIRLHLKPFFGGRRLASITTADVRTFIDERQQAGASNYEINRELTALKRMYSPAIEAGTLLHKPYIPMLEERTIRTGFFEHDQIESVIRHLPAALQPVVTFAYLTGWRMASETLPLEGRQIDVAVGEIRLDPETTKNREGRTFPMTDDLRRMLEEQHAEWKQLQKAGHVVPWVFWRMVANGRRGPKAPQAIASLTKACGTWSAPGFRVPSP